MSHVDDQAVSADEIEDGYFAKKMPLEASLCDDTPELVAEQIEEEPRQEREVVGREEIIGRKAEESEPLELIKRVGQMDERSGEEAECAVRNIVAQCEQQKEQDRADIGIHAAEQFAQSVGEEHRAADKAEHAEEDRLVGREDHGDDGGDDTAEGDDQSPAKAVAREMQRDTRYDDEGGADQPLPDDHGNSAVKTAPYAEGAENVIAQMVDDHIDDGNTANGVDQAVALRFVHKIPFMRAGVNSGDIVNEVVTCFIEESQRDAQKAFDPFKGEQLHLFADRLDGLAAVGIEPPPVDGDHARDDEFSHQVQPQFADLDVLQDKQLEFAFEQIGDLALKADVRVHAQEIAEKVGIGIDDLGQLFKDEIGALQTVLKADTRHLFVDQADDVVFDLADDLIICRRSSCRRSCG